jgi:2-iminoacetate synthase ThiH
MDAVYSARALWSGADLLVLGAVADALRTEGVGETVCIHERRNTIPDVLWVELAKGTTELDMLRAVAVARIGHATGARIGVDWSDCGLELAQVALGFGASELRGPLTTKSGLPIYEDEKRKVKGQGMVELRAIKKREIASLVTHAGRIPVFVEETIPKTRDSSMEVSNV